MRLNLQHFSIRSTNALDSWVEDNIFSLKPSLQIDEANVRLAHHPECSPSYQVRVHLVTPGPDVSAEASDHTLLAAFAKVMAELRLKIAGRNSRRSSRLRSRAPLAPGKSREAHRLN